MERTKKVDKVKFQKIGGGSFRLKNGRIIKPNQIFKAYPSEIPKAFTDLIKPLEDIKEEPVEIIDTVYTLNSRSVGWWDVVDIDGKIMNENALRKEAAEELLNNLLGN